MSDIRWRGYEHPELHKMIHEGPGARASDPLTEYWIGLTEELAAVDKELNEGLGKLKANWSGAAADSAAKGLTPLQQWASDAQTGSKVMKLSSEDQAQYVSSARTRMPEPVVVTTPEPSPWQKVTATAASVVGVSGPAAAVAEQSADHEAQEQAKTQAAELAVETMTTYESNSEFNQNTLGQFVSPPEVVLTVAPITDGPAGPGVNQTHNPIAGPGSNTGGTTSSSFVAPTGSNLGGNIPTGPGGSVLTGTTPTTGSGVTGGVVSTTPLVPTGAVSTTTAQTFAPPITSNPTSTPTAPGTPLPSPTQAPAAGPVHTPLGSGQYPNGPTTTGPGLAPNPSTTVAGPKGGVPLSPGMSPVEESLNGRRPGPGMGSGSASSLSPAEEAIARRGAIGGQAAAGGGGLGGGGLTGGGTGPGSSTRPASRLGRGANGGLGRPARAEDDEDQEYQAQGYLTENDDVFGVDDRMVVAPVIGELS